MYRQNNRAYAVDVGVEKVSNVGHEPRGKLHANWEPHRVQDSSCGKPFLEHQRYLVTNGGRVSERGRR